MKPYDKHKLFENMLRFKTKNLFLYEELNKAELSFPIIVKGSFTGSTGDELHAFQSTGGRKIGKMQDIVNAELKKVYNSGYNPDVTDIEVTIDKKSMTTSWSVTINKSKDGKAYVGIVTVGSCCTNDYQKRADGQVNAMKNWGNAKPADHKLIAVLQTTDDGTSNGNITIKGGKYKLKQHFYKYSQDSKKPHTSK